MGEVGSESTVFMPSPGKDLPLAQREHEVNEEIEEKWGQKAVPPRGLSVDLTLFTSSFGLDRKATAAVPWAAL